MPTIAEEIRTWKITKGNPNPNAKKLLETLVFYSQRNNYNLFIETPDYSETTFHPLKVPITIDEARKKYGKEGIRAIDPLFIDLVNKVEKYNLFCKYSEGYKEKINQIEVNDFMNFLYFTEKIIEKEGGHERMRKRGFDYIHFLCSIQEIIKERDYKNIRKKVIFRRKEVDDPNPIVVFTNPKKDGLLDVLKEPLTDVMVKSNRGLRVFVCGGSSESLRDFYSDKKIKDFGFVNVEFRNPADEYFGIYTRKGGCIEGKFLRNPDLLGFGNIIKGEFVFGGPLVGVNYRAKLILFNYLKI